MIQLSYLEGGRFGGTPGWLRTGDTLLPWHREGYVWGRHVDGVTLENGLQGTVFVPVHCPPPHRWGGVCFANPHHAQS